MKSMVAVVVALAALLGQACATSPAGPATATLASPCDDCQRGVTDFAVISPALWRGSQPTPAGFRDLELAGVHTVIDFRHVDNGAEILKGTKLRYVSMPTRPWNPSVEDLVPFLRVVQDPENWPVYVYCWKGHDRSGFYVAAYRMVVDGWSPDDAIREMFRFRYNPFWYRIPAVLRGIDVAKLQARVAAQSDR